MSKAWNLPAQNFAEQTGKKIPLWRQCTQQERTPCRRKAANPLLVKGGFLPLDLLQDGRKLSLTPGHPGHHRDHTAGRLLSWACKPQGSGVRTTFA